jgi:hypothetical protein
MVRTHLELDLVPLPLPPQVCVGPASPYTPAPYQRLKPLHLAYVLLRSWACPRACTWVSLASYSKLPTLLGLRSIGLYLLPPQFLRGGLS